jgi:Tol biopolymer transport system component
MSDLEDRLRGVDQVAPPPPLDWGDIERRAGATEPAPSSRRRVASASVAAAIAILASLFAYRAFSGIGDGAATSLRTNGPIAFTDYGPAPADIPFDNIDVYAWDPTTGQRSNLTNTPNVDEESLSWSPDRTQVVFQRTIASGTGADFATRSAIVLANADFSQQSVLRTCEDGCGVTTVAWSPDGTRLAWTIPIHLDNGWVGGLQTYDLATGETTTICASSDCGDPGQPTWSPDGNEIAYSNTGSFTRFGLGPQTGPIWIADVGSGYVHALTDVNVCSFGANGQPCVFDSSPQWAADGRTIVFVRSSQSNTGATKSLMAIGVDGSGERTLTTCDAGDQCTYYELAMSPDASHVAFSDRYDRASIQVVEVATGEDSTFTVPGRSAPVALTWSPDGSDLAVLAGGRQADLLLLHLQNGEVETVLPQATSQGDLLWLSKGAVTLPSPMEPSQSISTAPLVLPPGTIVFSSSSGSSGEDDATEIWSMHTDGSGLTQLTSNSHLDIDPALSPDGTRIAFASYRAGDRNTQIYVMNADGSEQRPLTDLRTGATQPSWSPDGSMLAFVSGAGWGELGGVFVMQPDGGKPWLVGEGSAYSPTWSADGSSVIYALGGDNRDGFWTAPTHIIDCIPGPCPVPPGVATELFSLPGSVDEPDLSPDGKTLAFVWSSGSSSAIYTSGLQGDDLRKVAVGSSPTWSPDGRWLAFSHIDDIDGPQVWVMRSDGSDATAITSLPGFISGTTIYGITRDPSWGA